MHKLAPASDPIWADEDFRTETFIGLMEEHGLTIKDVMALTNKKYHGVYPWTIRGKRRTIPIEVLRSLMYDLQSE